MALLQPLPPLPQSQSPCVQRSKFFDCKYLQHSSCSLLCLCNVYKAVPLQIAGPFFPPW